MKRPALAIVAATLFAAPGCGSLATAPDLERAKTAQDELTERAIATLGLDEGKLERRATLPSKAHGRHAIYLAPKNEGGACVLDVTEDRLGAGCNAVLFGEHDVAFVESSEGGPARGAMTELRLAGVASPRVRSLELELSDGTRARVPLAAGNAFLYEAAASDLRDGVVPAALHAFNAGGRQLDTLPLGSPPPA
jgi:hypothetical protein